MGEVANGVEVSAPDLGRLLGFFLPAHVLDAHEAGDGVFGLSVGSHRKVEPHLAGVFGDECSRRTPRQVLVGGVDEQCRVVLELAQRLAARDTDLAVLKAVLGGEYEPVRALRPDLPLELEQRLERLTSEISEAYIDALKCRDGNMGGVIKFWFEGRFTSFREARTEP